MPHRDRLQPLNRDGDLRPARTHPRRRVSSEPAEYVPLFGKDLEIVGN
jgi:hypothetical protein